SHLDCYASHISNPCVPVIRLDALFHFAIHSTCRRTIGLRRRGYEVPRAAIVRDVDQRRGCLLSLLSLPIEHRHQITELFCYPAERLGLFHEGTVVILPNENLFGGFIEPLEILSKLFAQLHVEIADYLTERVD